MRIQSMLRICGMALIAVVLLGSAGGSAALAQSGGGNSSPKGNAAAPQNAASRPGSGGLNAGTKIHGHWMIETRNPDGKVARHAEFENSLSTPDFLVGLIAGEYTWGGLSIDLRGSPGPCSTNPTKAGIFAGQCEIYLPAQQVVVTNAKCGTSATAASPQPYCYATLASSPSWDPNLAVFTGLTLTGQAYADTTTSLTSVATYSWRCQNTGPNNGQFGTSALAPSACISGSPLSHQFTGLSLAAAPNCGGSGQSPCQVPVVAGQTISVTVNYTFQ